jgi:single-strand DNA-binding protein
MANDVVITIMGRLTADPEIRFVANGGAVTSFTTAHNSRRFDKAKNEWVDSEVTWYRCSLWGGAAENVANTLRKGNAVIVVGALGTRSWEQNGEKKSAMEVKVEKVGLDLGFYTVAPEHVVASNHRGGQSSAPAQQSDVSAPGGSSSDPWAAQGASSNEVPF